MKDLSLLKSKGDYLLLGVKDGNAPSNADMVLMTTDSSLGDIRRVPIQGQVFPRETALKFAPADMFADNPHPLDLRHKAPLTHEQFLLLGKFQLACLLAAQHVLQQEGLSVKSLGVFDLWHGIDPATGQFMCLMGFHDYSVHKPSLVEPPARTTPPRASAPPARTAPARRRFLQEVHVVRLDSRSPTNQECAQALGVITDCPFAETPDQVRLLKHLKQSLNSLTTEFTPPWKCVSACDSRRSDFDVAEAIMSEFDRRAPVPDADLNTWWFSATLNDVQHVFVFLYDCAVKE